MPTSKLFGYDAELTLHMPGGEIHLRDFLDQDALSVGTLQINRRAVIDAITDYQAAARNSETVPADALEFVERVR